MDIACSSITWGQVRRQENGPYAGEAGQEKILDEIRNAGYSFAVANIRRLAAGERVGSDPAATPEGQIRLFREHGLQVAPGSTGGFALRDAGKRDENVAGARQAAAYTRALGLDALFLMPEGDPRRREAPGQFLRGRRPDAQPPEEVATTCETLNRMGEACRAEGVWLCLHNHAGMFWETEDEFEEVVSGTDASLVGLGPDVGHMVFGGMDPLPWFRRHMDRVKSIHIKDLDAAVLEQVRKERLPMGEALAHNIWVEIGSGAIDWPSLFSFWREHGFDGAVVVESDRTPLPTPAESVAKSRRYLRETCGE